MECPHLRENVKVNRDFIRNRKFELNTKKPSTDSTEKGSAKLWKCLDCTSEKENWMCLTCGQVRCGRYENGHALHHSTLNSQHNVCLNTATCSVFCYKCDNYVSNATQLLDNLRDEFKDDDSLSDGSNLMEESSSSSSSRSNSVSSDSGCYEEATGSDGGKTHRQLRPRKRTSSPQIEKVSPSPRKKKLMRKVVGLRNIGNTCFLNSVVQALHNIEEFSSYFNALPSLEKPQRRFYNSRSQKDDMADVNVAEEVRKVMVSLSHDGDTTKTIYPGDLINIVRRVWPHFNIIEQQDSHEFMRYMLDRLHTELHGMSTPAPTQGDSTNDKPHSLRTKSTIVTNVFGGTLQSEVRCLTCGTESKKHDPFLDLSLDIPEDFIKENSAIGQSVCDLSDCLSSFTEVEELAETELYYCNSCKCKQRSTKRFAIRRLPNILCLHIKRFRWWNRKSIKIDSRITFPLTSLDMSKYALQNVPDSRRSHLNNNVYDLTTVVEHVGSGLNHGHYRAYVKIEDTWLLFNDANVKEVHVRSVAECKPYLLFYSRRDLNN